MARIESLTAEQQALLPQFREEWLKVGTNTARADRAKAEAAILAMRTEIGKHTKPVFVWCDSPATALLAIHVVKSPEWRKLVASLPAAKVASETGDPLGASLGTSLGDSLKASLWEVAGEIGDPLKDSLGDSLWESLWDSLWDSLGGSLGDSLWGSLWDSLGDSLRDSLGASVRASLWAGLGDGLGANLSASFWDGLGDGLGASFRDSLGDGLGASLRDNLRIGLWGSLRDSFGDSVQSDMGNAWWGQHDAYWVAFYLFCRDIVGVEYDAKRSRQLDMWRDVAQSCCWWWPYEHLVFCSERPTRVGMDERERIHSADGPAIGFADGWVVHAWHGVRVPWQVIEAPETLTPAQIEGERNAEVRRVMVERFGAERYLLEGGAKKVHEDECGVLYRKEQPDDEPLVMVHVVNSSAEPDGSHKKYMLRVPPTVQTAREGVAWTFGMKPDEYRPQVET